MEVQILVQKLFRDKGRLIYSGLRKFVEYFPQLSL